MKQNRDVANDLRNILYVFIKEYMKLENNTGINNPAECNGCTLDQIRKFGELFDEYRGVVRRLYWHIERLLKEEK